MTASNSAQPELPDFISLLSVAFRGNAFFDCLHQWHIIVYSMIVVALLTLFAYFATRRTSFIPNRLQNAAEVIAGSIDDLVSGILGPAGRKYTPFIGTLFLYILGMNLLGLIPFMKSATSDWSITLGLSICVFVYVQYTAIRAMGVFGYADHLAGRPRGVLAWTVILPLTTFIVHLLSEFIKPISLSLRLRSNIWGEDIMLAVMAGFGLKGIPLLFLNTLMALLTAIVQALVFTLLSTIYFALVLTKEEH